AAAPRPAPSATGSKPGCWASTSASRRRWPGSRSQAGRTRSTATCTRLARTASASTPRCRWTSAAGKRSDPSGGGWGMKTHRMLINNRWVESAGGERYEVTNPATGDVLATVPDAGVEDARAAIDAAYEAFASWSALPAHVRSQAMRRFYELILDRADDLARLLSEEQGKPL